ncbi:hypothetical protein ACRYCC_26335 [Actinomadura scrupuli]|uniref:hypothetical protein n=1 Tax=Actinomadura scrupuli TaxID=559629 RepID=UPI003D990618
MTMALPEPGIAVDPNRVLSHLRQAHAQRLDAADFQVAQLTAALEDAQATIGELRIRAEELGNANVALQARVNELGGQKAELEQQLAEAKLPAEAPAAAPAAAPAVPGPPAKGAARSGRT